MFCTYCGNKLHAQAVICPSCGCPTRQVQTVTAVRKQNARPMVGFILSLCALPLMFLSLTGIAGVAAFIVSLVEFLSAKRRKVNYEFALAGLVLGAVFTLFFLFGVVNWVSKTMWAA